MAVELDARDPHIGARARPEQRAIRQQIVDGIDGAGLGIRQTVELRGAGERERIRAVLQLGLQAHVAGAVERQHRYADDHDEHDGHVRQNHAACVAPERRRKPLCRFDHTLQ